MSAHIQWQPMRPVKSNVLNETIKFVLGPHYWGHDGTLSSDPIVLTDADRPYLMGVRDAGNDDVRKSADELLEAIEKYGEIELWISR